MRSLVKCAFWALRSPSKRKVGQLLSATRSVKVGASKLAPLFGQSTLQLWSAKVTQKRFYSSTNDKKTTDPQITRGFAVIDTDPKEALKIFVTLHKEVGNDESVLYGQATALFNLNRCDEALKVLDVLSVAHPNAPISSLRGRIHSHLGNTELAIAFFSDAVERFPNDFGVLETLGNAYLVADKYVEAIQTYEKANEMRPNNWVIILHMSSAYRRLGSNYMLTAGSLGEQAVELQPQSPEVWHNLAGFYEAIGEFDAALECYAKMTALQPALTAWSYQEATLLIRMNRLDQAENLLLKLLEIPNDDLHRRTGIQLLKVYAALKRNQEAKKLATTLTKKFPFSSSVWYYFGKTCVASEIDKAIQYFEHALSLESDERVQNALACCYFIKGEHDQAVKYFRQVNNFSFEVLEMNGMFSEGQALIDFLHKRFPEHSKAVFEVQMHLASFKRDFIEEFQSYISSLKASNNPLDQVDLLLLHNDFEDAMQKVDQILASKSEHEKSDAVISKAIVLLEYDRVKEAITFLQVHQPEHANVGYYEVIATALSRNDESLDEAEQVCSQLPGNYATQMALSEVDYRRGHYEQAMESWKRAQTINNTLPNSPPGAAFPMRYLSIQQKAKILEAMGNTEEAAEEYIRVLAINPLDLVSKQRLTALQAKFERLSLLATSNGSEESVKMFMRMDVLMSSPK